MGEKAKKAIFYIIIGILLMLIGGVAVAMYFYIKSEDDTIDYEYSSDKYTSVVTSSTTIEESSTESTSTETTSVVSDSTSATNAVTTSQVTETTKKTNATKSTGGTKKTSVSSYSTEWSTSWSSSYSTSWTMSSLTIPPSTTTTRETVVSISTYPNADSNREWDILDYVNAERRKRGLNDLGMVAEFRTIAEKAADKWDGQGPPPTDILGNHAWYVKSSNGTGYDSSYFAKKLIEAVPSITTSSKIYYLGVGVIRKSGLNKMAVIYE